MISCSMIIEVDLSLKDHQCILIFINQCLLKYAHFVLVVLAEWWAQLTKKMTNESDFHFINYCNSVDENQTNRPRILVSGNTMQYTLWFWEKYNFYFVQIWFIINIFSSKNNRNTLKYIVSTPWCREVRWIGVYNAFGNSCRGIYVLVPVLEWKISRSTHWVYEICMKGQIQGDDIKNNVDGKTKRRLTTML